ncbi:DUF4054 domain-containing protein [Escherichia coli]|uniref:DUF4054 domain-containing protein n=1 Tax=Escherichia coli TaxID=562 RepID=UPI001F2B1E10|nr:DUF4054 domain-containing protein [Escherichia coli]
MSNVFVFDPAAFKLSYPQFAKFTNEQLTNFFEEVENTIVDNTESSCFSLKDRKKRFYLLVAHNAELQNRINDGNTGLVGRISSATEGSVSISTDYSMGSGALEQWLKQTPYGAKFYAFTAPYRTALWVAATAPMPVKRTKWPYPFGWGNY